MTENYELRLSDFGLDGFSRYAERNQEGSTYWLSLSWRGALLIPSSALLFVLENAKKGLETLVKKN